MIDEKTANRNYPLPHPNNMLEEDVTRITDSFVQIDLDVNDLYSTTAQSTDNLQSGSYWYGASTGTGSAYEVVLNPTPISLTPGMFIRMKAHVQNMGSATINLNSLGIKNIKRIDGSDLKKGDIPQNALITLIYDGANFQLSNTIADPEMEAINTSNIMLAFDEIQENHGGALLMETGWSDSFSNPNEQGADEVNSTGFEYDSENKLYQGTNPGLGLTSDKDYDIESDYLQQEWTNANQGTSQATFTNGSTQVILSTGNFPANCNNGRIKSSDSNFYDIISGQGTNTLTLSSNFTGTTGDYNYVIRTSKFESGLAQLNNGGLAYFTETLDVAITDMSSSTNYTISNEAPSIGRYYAQVFQATQTGPLTKVTIKVWPHSYDDNVHCRIYSVNGGIPTSTVLANSQVIYSNILNDETEHDFIFPSPTSVISGNFYALAVGRLGSLANSHFKLKSATNNIYTLGKSFAGNGDGSWNEVSNHDMYLKTYVNVYTPNANVINQHTSICDAESKKTDTNSWLKINSSSVIENANLQTINYWFIFDPIANLGNETEIKIFNTTGSIWRKIARNNNGIWQYNDEPSNTVNEIWVNAETNEMLHAVSEAISSQASNRMIGSDLDSINTTQWENLNGFTSSVNSVIRGTTLFSDNDEQNPSVSQYSLNYDSERGTMDLWSKTYDPDFEPLEAYLWARSEYSNTDGSGTFYISRNDGVEWTAISMVQQGLPLSGHIRILRGMVNLTGQTPGQNLRCRLKTEQGKDQFLHSWGLQVKP